MCLENTSKDFTANNLKKTGLSGYVYECSVAYNIIDTSNTIDNQKYLIKKHDIKNFWNHCKTFIVLLPSIAYAFNHTKCVSLSNQKREIEPTLINLHPYEYSQEFCCNQFAVKLIDVLEILLL